MTPPADAVSAVTHPDPYPFYADLVARPVFRDPALGFWVAASAAAVTSVLEDERARVRPPRELVPRSLVGSRAGEVFGHLVRMNDGPRHLALKGAVSGGLETVVARAAAAQGRASARLLADELASGKIKPGELAFRMPIHVVGHLLGIPSEDLDSTTRRIDALTRGFAPGASALEVEAAGQAAGELLSVMADLAAIAAADTLLGRLRDGMRSSPSAEDPGVVAANGVGMLTQGYEATAALIGNTLLALTDDPSLRRRVTEEPHCLRDVVLEVARHDAPVQNTRRWMAEDGTAAGQEMKEGDGILVVLAAANRDPAANDDPHRFDIDRPNRRSFTFGVGRHGCPGEALAVTIAEAAVAALAASPNGLPAVARPVVYRRSGNVRLPTFGA